MISLVSVYILLCLSIFSYPLWDCGQAGKLWTIVNLVAAAACLVHNLVKFPREIRRLGAWMYQRELSSTKRE